MTPDQRWAQLHELVEPVIAAKIAQLDDPEVRALLEAIVNLFATNGRCSPYPWWIIPVLASAETLTPAETVGTGAYRLSNNHRVLQTNVPFSASQSDETRWCEGRHP